MEYIITAAFLIAEIIYIYYKVSNSDLETEEINNLRKK